MRNLFRYFNSSPEVIRLAVMMYIRYPLSLVQRLIYNPCFSGFICDHGHDATQRAEGIRIVSHADAPT
jgi:hypothetical protein